jgi:hypothetical protein
MTAEAKARLEDFLRARNDWRARCALCGVDLLGSLAEISEHAAGHRESHAGS